MADQELIKALKCCGSDGYNCGACPCFGECEADCGNRAPALAADRLEALLAENEELRAGVQMTVEFDPNANSFKMGFQQPRPNWVSVEDRLPESKEGQVLVIANGFYKSIFFRQAIEIAEFVRDEGWILESYPEWRTPPVSPTGCPSPNRPALRGWSE